MSNKHEERLRQIWDAINSYEEIYSFVADKFWTEYWPSSGIPKRDIDDETPEELVISLYEDNEFARFGFPYHIE